MLFFEQALNSTPVRSQRIYTTANEMSTLRSDMTSSRFFQNVGQLYIIIKQILLTIRMTYSQAHRFSFL